MKKIIKIIFLFVVINIFIKNVNAETFYLGDKVPNIYIYMDRINTSVYRQFRMIYKTDTNELVYCIEPGTSIAYDDYESDEEFNKKYNITTEKWERIKKIAHYGYLYKDHTDIKWYAITQYLIWHEVMPNEWDLYFVNENHQKLEKQFINEINEIYNLVNKHQTKPNISDKYIFNYKESVIISDNKNLLNYYSSNKGIISDNTINLTDKLLIGDNEIKLNYNNPKKIMFYYNANGQNIMTRGINYDENLKFNVHITAGEININECLDENIEHTFNGGTYEIIDQDNTVIDTITCENNKKCMTNKLPIGNYEIRVKELDNKFEENKYVYDVSVEDEKISDINICSRVKKQPKNIIENKIENKNSEKVIDIPYTYKDSKIKYIVNFIIIIIIITYIIKNVKNNK